MKKNTNTNTNTNKNTNNNKVATSHAERETIMNTNTNAPMITDYQRVVTSADRIATAIIKPTGELIEHEDTDKTEEVFLVKIRIGQRVYKAQNNYTLTKGRFYYIVKTWLESGVYDKRMDAKLAMEALNVFGKPANECYFDKAKYVECFYEYLYKNNISPDVILVPGKTSCFITTEQQHLEYLAKRKKEAEERKARYEKSYLFKELNK